MPVQGGDQCRGHRTGAAGLGFVFNPALVSADVELVFRHLNEINIGAGRFEKFVMAGLANEYGFDKVQQAYRSWFSPRTERHGEHIAKLARKLRDLGDKRDGQ